MTVVALDTSCLVSWLRQDVQAWRTIDRILTDPHTTAVMPGPVLAEVIRVMGRGGHNTASPQQLATALTANGLTVEPTDESALVRAGELMRLSDAHAGPSSPDVRPATLSLADALILATCESGGLPLLTHDVYMAEFAAMHCPGITVHRVRRGASE